MVEQHLKPPPFRTFLTLGLTEGCVRLFLSLFRNDNLTSKLTSAVITLVCGSDKVGKGFNFSFRIAIFLQSPYGYHMTYS